MRPPCVWETLTQADGWATRNAKPRLCCVAARAQMCRWRRRFRAHHPNPWGNEQIPGLLNIFAPVRVGRRHRGSGQWAHGRPTSCVEYCDTLDIDNLIVGAGRISRRRHEQRDAGQAMDFAHGLRFGRSTSVRSTERRCRTSGLT